MQDSNIASKVVVPNLSGTLLEMYEVVEAKISNGGEIDDEVRDLTVKLVLAIAETFGGHAFYLPKGAVTKRWLRNYRLYQDWRTGMAHNDLIKKYKLSSAIVYGVVTKMRAAYK